MYINFALVFTVPRFEFEEEHYQAEENDTVTVCVLLKEGRLGTTVRLVLTTINGSAIGMMALHYT